MLINRVSYIYVFRVSLSILRSISKDLFSPEIFIKTVALLDIFLSIIYNDDNKINIFLYKSEIIYNNKNLKYILYNNILYSIRIGIICILIVVGNEYIYENIYKILEKNIKIFGFEIISKSQIEEFYKIINQMVRPEMTVCASDWLSVIMKGLSEEGSALQEVCLLLICEYVIRVPSYSTGTPPRIVASAFTIASISHMRCDFTPSPHLLLGNTKFYEMCPCTHENNEFNKKNDIYNENSKNIEYNKKNDIYNEKLKKVLNFIVGELNITAEFSLAVGEEALKLTSCWLNSSAVLRDHYTKLS
eukprot:GHVL01021784.1.p1 GENE.GHVL01021784.1~~GHVL01021784.1.p1  ORF type:complete len:303 (+),score=93.30 GHVL01021784.1:78-986(+)